MSKQLTSEQIKAILFDAVSVISDDGELPLKLREHMFSLFAALAAKEAENAAMREALTFYADPDTYEQVDILGKCGLSDDHNDDGYGARARAIIAPPAVTSEAKEKDHA